MPAQLDGQLAVGCRDAHVRNDPAPYVAHLHVNVEIENTDSSLLVRATHQHRTFGVPVARPLTTHRYLAGGYIEDEAAVLPRSDHAILSLHGFEGVVVLAGHVEPPVGLGLMGVVVGTRVGEPAQHVTHRAERPR